MQGPPINSSIERPWSTTSSAQQKASSSSGSLTNTNNTTASTTNSNSTSNAVSSENQLIRKISISLESIQLPPIKSNETTPTSKSTTTTATSDTPSLPTSFWPPSSPDVKNSTTTDTSTSTETTTIPSSSSSSQTQLFAAVKLSEKEKKQNSLKILETLLKSPVLTGVNLTNSISSSNINYLIELLTHKNDDGSTPFMYAVNLRAYEAALLIFESILKIRVELLVLLAQKSSPTTKVNCDLLVTNMLFPLGSKLDHSPLYVLCSNDTCSFTWTGDTHITQDIFECRTCTLVGNLCCCTECARTCHKGHDCVIKTSSPTAYCDCWEKCKCKSLIAGDQEKRLKLLDKILAETNLLALSSHKSEHLLIYLAQVTGRQMQEQKNYKRHCGGGSSSSNSSSSSSRKMGYNSDSGGSSGGGGGIGDMPQHDLEPPNFARRALERILNDWESIKQIFLFNYSRLGEEVEEESQAWVNKKNNYLFRKSLISSLSN
jgi:E3 ubiquitin-protein ligase EDD1